MTEIRREQVAAAAGESPERRDTDFVTVAFLTLRWDVDKKTVYKWIAGGLLEAVSLPDVGYRVQMAVVRAFEQKHLRSPS